MERTGAHGPTELADLVGLEGRHAPQKVSRWLKGVNEPDYKTTLILLGHAGLLREDTDP